MKKSPSLIDLVKRLPPNWKKKLAPLFREPFFERLNQFLDDEYQSNKEIYPARENIFRALRELDLPDVKVVILGQDPYHGSDQAIGFSFAVPNDVFPKPPSLRNIFKELESDLGISVPKEYSDLTAWASQGVLLLNTVLTVEAAKPLSHRGQGWEEFTNQVMAHLGARKEPLVFVLWGSHAQKMKTHIDLNIHEVIESPHPSPLSSYRGFFGSRVFSRTNALLARFGKAPIRWETISLVR